MGIYNGCGGEGGLKFGAIVRANVQFFPQYDRDLAIKFWEGIEQEICRPHDERFYIGGGLIAYIWANTVFAYQFTIKLWWTGYIVYFLAFPVLFLGLNFFGVKYFHWCWPSNKRKLGVYFDEL